MPGGVEYWLGVKFVLVGPKTLGEPTGEELVAYMFCVEPDKYGSADAGIEDIPSTGQFDGVPPVNAARAHSLGIDVGGACSYGEERIPLIDLL